MPATTTLRSEQGLMRRPLLKPLDLVSINLLVQVYLRPKRLFIGFQDRPVMFMCDFAGILAYNAD